MKRQILLTKKSNGINQLNTLFQHYGGLILWFRGKQSMVTPLALFFDADKPEEIENAIAHCRDDSTSAAEKVIAVNTFDLHGNPITDAENNLAYLVNRFGIANTLCIFDHAITEGSKFFRALLQFPSALMCDIVFIQDELNDFYTVLDSVSEGIRSDIYESDFYSSWDIVSDTDKMIVYNWYGVCEHDLESTVDLPTKNKIRRALCSLSSDEDIAKMAAVLHPDEECSILCNDSVNTIFLTCKRHKDIWYPAMQELFRIPQDIPLETFAEKYHDLCRTIQWNKKMERYLHLAAGTNCKTAIVADITPFDIQRLDERIHLGRLSHIWLSCETMLLSSDKTVFHQMLLDSLIVPENILFIDSSAAKLSAAKKIGLQTLQYCSLSKKYTENFINSFLHEDARISFIPSLFAPNIKDCIL